VSKLTLGQACDIVDAALAMGRELQLKPLTVAVLDVGGHLLAFKREDGAAILRPQIAIGKAWGALALGVSTRTLAEANSQRPVFLTALCATSGGQVVPVPGGVLVRDADGEIIGAVGISGDLSDRDEGCAIAGVKTAELVPDPAEPMA